MSRLSTFGLLVALFTVAATVVEGDDTEAFRHTLSSLCELNKVGVFADCCSTVDLSSVTMYTGWDCFARNVKYKGDFITELNFMKRNITSLGTGSFSSLTGLKSLTFYSNGIASIDSGAFNGLSSLVSLELSSNSLVSIPSDLFTGLSSLVDLSLDVNGLTEVPSNIFLNNTKLEIIFLDTNSLSRLPSGLFNNNPKLRWLNLHRNRLTSLPSGIFTNNSKLDTLHIEENNLKSLPDDTFSEITRMVTLNISSNSLTSINMGKTTSSNLDVSFNYLVEFLQDESVLSDNNLLMELYLNGNCLDESKIPSYNSTEVTVDVGTDQTRCKGMSKSVKLAIIFGGIFLGFIVIGLVVAAVFICKRESSRKGYDEVTDHQ